MRMKEHLAKEAAWRKTLIGAADVILETKGPIDMEDSSLYTTRNDRDRELEAKIVETATTHTGYQGMIDQASRELVRAAADHPEKVPLKSVQGDIDLTPPKKARDRDKSNRNI